MINKEVFIEAMTAGGDLGPQRAEELYEIENDKRLCHHLDQLMGTALKGDSPESDLKYCIRQLESALNVIQRYPDDDHS